MTTLTMRCAQLTIAVLLTMACVGGMSWPVSSLPASAAAIAPLPADLEAAVGIPADEVLGRAVIARPAMSTPTPTPTPMSTPTPTPTPMPLPTPMPKGQGDAVAPTEPPTPPQGVVALATAPPPPPLVFDHEVPAHDDGAAQTPPPGVTDTHSVPETDTRDVDTAVAPVQLSSGVERGERVLAGLGFDPAQVGYTLSFEADRPALRGLTFTRDRHIEIYVRPSMSDHELAYVIAHELGHAVDHMLNSRLDRAVWRDARGMDVGLAWWPDHRGNDLETPAGDFAECFASWLVGTASQSMWGDCAPVAALVGELVAR